jgi:hypothetical protein
VSVGSDPNVFDSSSAVLFNQLSMLGIPRSGSRNERLS